MKDQVRVAAVAFEGRPGDTAGNLEGIDAWCTRAGAAGADLVLFPELSLTGFVPNHPTGDHAQWLASVLRGARSMAEPLDGAAMGRLLEISNRTGLYIAAGMLEDAGHLLFNTHVLVGEGRLLGHWRKMHIPLFEMQVYNGGGAPMVVDTALGRIGVNICFDAFLPESTRLLAVRGAEIVLFPFAADPPPATAAAWVAWARPVLQARCGENGVFGVACNCVGEVAYAGARQRFPGGALILDPTGAVQGCHEAETGEAAMLTATLDAAVLADARARFEYTFRFRRPELYVSLAEG